MPRHGISPPKAPPKLTDSLTSGGGIDHIEWEGGRIPAGIRDTTIFQMACRWRDMGADYECVRLACMQLDAEFCDPPLGPNTVRAKVSSAFTREARDQGPPAVDDWQAPLVAEDFGAYVQAKPPRYPLLGPLLTGQVGFTYGPPGVGKSIFALLTGNAVGLGEGLGGQWGGSGTRQPVLLIDGEMDDHDIYDRFDLFDRPPAVDFLTSSMFPAGGLNLADPAFHPLFLGWLRKYRMIILDNFSSLFFAADMDGNPFTPATWLNFSPMRNAVRAWGKHLLVIDHPNHAGKLQGTAAKRRDVDYVIRLSSVKEAPAWMEFDMSFKPPHGKYRGLAAPGDIMDQNWSIPDGQLKVYSQMETKDRIRGWKCINPGKTQADCMQATGLKKSTVQRYW